MNEKGLLESSQTIAHGTQYKLNNGVVVNLYTTGKLLVQGKDPDAKIEIEELLEVPKEVAKTVKVLDEVSPTQRVKAPTRVFIVYGHDAAAREQLELILRRLRLEPIVLQNIPGTGDTIIEKLETLTNADFACVLLTPDDEGREKSRDGENEKPLRPRARQNVILELGMVLTKLGRKRVAILLKGTNIEKPTDIDGLIWLGFTNRVDELKNELAANLQEAGFVIQVKDLLP